MLRPVYFVVPTIAILVASVGGRITDSGMDWYRTLRLPDWTPAGRVIGSVWTVLYILTSLSAIRVWTRYPRTDARFRDIIALFVVNAVINLAWSAVFFWLHWMRVAVADAALIAATVLALILLIWPRDRIAAALLLPYLAWVTFATFLNAAIVRLN